jgi:peptidoglycan LD-endopeptidase LytH
MFGCVRNPGNSGIFTRFHEGVDIRALQHDEDGEPADHVYSAGAGRVVYLCPDPDHSNYGKHIILEHTLFKVPFYTLYAHLSKIEKGLDVGDEIPRGHRLGVVGRTSNHFEIEQDYAHLHFEVDLLVNDRYVEYSRKKGDGTPNHGLYNGANLIGIDPVRFFQFLQVNPDLGISDFVSREPIAFRVMVPAKEKISWLERYPSTAKKPLASSHEAYEISMTYYGLPVRIEPRRLSEISESAQDALSEGLYPVTYANNHDLTTHSACRLLRQNGKYWELSGKGVEWIQQLAY